MICLDRFQKVLAAHLDIDFETLPSIADVLIAQGFRGMSVGEKITYFDEQAIKRVRDGAESKAVDSGTLESKEIDFKNKDEAIKYLENLKGEKLPKELSEAEFLTQGLSEIVNKENFLRHTKTRIDSDKRLKYLNLVEPTLEKYNIKLSTNERNTYIKKFETQDNNLYYMLITDDGDKLLITGIPTNQFRNIRSKIKNADLIQTFTSQDSKNPQGLNGLSSADSSIESKIAQAQYDALEKEIRQQRKSILKDWEAKKEELRKLEPLYEKWVQKGQKKAGKSIEKRYLDTRAQKLELEAALDELDEKQLAAKAALKGISKEELERQMLISSLAQDAKDYKAEMFKNADFLEYKSLSGQAQDEFYKDMVRFSIDGAFITPRTKDGGFVDNRAKYKKVLDYIAIDKLPRIIPDEIRYSMYGLAMARANRIVEHEFLSPMNAYFRQNLEKMLNIKPLKEFGTNYIEYYHNGRNAIKKLLLEAEDAARHGELANYKGQVAGAFHKEGLGDIDLVWGEVTDSAAHKGYGLAHIIDKRKAEFIQQGLSEAEAESLAQNFAKEIPQIIENGKVVTQNNVNTIWYKDADSKLYKIGISQGFHHKGNNNWIVTGYEATREKDKTFGDALFADKQPLSNLDKGNDSIESVKRQDSKIDYKLKETDSNIIKEIESKFDFTPKKAYDLYEWHKDSSPLTKDSNGLPKVFYHGSKSKDIEIFQSQKDKSGLGFWFVSDKNYTTLKGNNIYKAFLNIKKPLDLRTNNENYPFRIENEIIEKGLSLDPYKKTSKETKEFLKAKGYDSIITDGDNEKYPFIIVFDSNQIKSIDNKGKNGKFFNENEANINYKMDFMEKEIESKPIVLKTQGIKNYKTLNSEFVESIAPILKKDIRNKETGIVAQISSTGVNKIKSKAAVDKSLENGFSKEEHFEVAKNLKELFEDSKYLRSEEPNNKSQDIKAVHRYGVNIDINDKQAQVLFTLKESVEHGNRIYSLELESIQRPKALKSVPEKQVDGLTNSVSFGGDAKSPIAENVNGNATKKIESLQDLERIFKKNNTDSINNELFDKVFSVAKDLKVEYSNEILGNRNILGQYNANSNKITLQDFSSETILHEMIHAVSSRAIDNPQVLKPVQKHAIKNLNRIYNRLKLDSKFKGEYALNSVKEMVAELSNPAFREKLKSRNLWQRIIDSIANLFGFRKDSSNYAKISKNLSKIIDNYDTNFTKNIESKNIDFAKKNKDIIESKDSNQGKNMDLRNKFLDKMGNIKYNELKEIAENLPAPLSENEFIGQFALKNGKNTTHIKTPIKEIEISPKKAYKHLLENSKEQDRNRISGAILPTLQKPLFIVRDNERESYLFYKPFLDEKGVLNMISIQVPKSNRLEYKTSYIADRQRMLKMINEYELIYYDKGNEAI